MSEKKNYSKLGDESVEVTLTAGKEEQKSAEGGKKRSFKSLASVCYALLMGNIEYAIVMPSLWLYLQKLDPSIPEYYFGITLGAFNLAQMLTSPFFGFWLDKRPMKEVIVFCLFVGVIGNSLYALANDIYLILVARVISGIGGNIYNTSMTYVIRVSEADERSALYAKVNLVYYMGMLMGPALNYPLSLLGNYGFGPFSLGPLNSPGFLMVLMLMLSIVAVMMFFEEPQHHSEEEMAPLPGDEGCFGLAKYRPLVNSFTLMSVIVIQFIVQYNQITLETVVTPLTKDWYDFGQLANSLVYAAITGVFFIWFFVIMMVAKKVQDRVLMLIGLAWLGAAFLSSTIIMFSRGAEFEMPFWLFGVEVALIVSGIPFFLSSLGSLFSKLVGDKRIQGMGQSMLSAAVSLASIAGPLISGFVLPYGMRIIFAILLGCWSIIVVLMLFRWKHLVPVVKDENLVTDVLEADEAEKETLLARPRSLSNGFADVERGSHELPQHGSVNSSINKVPQ